MSCRSAHKTSQKIGFMSRSIRFGNTNNRKGRLKYVFYKEKTVSYTHT